MALVCLCHGVSDRIVNEAIETGARSIEEIGATCAAGSTCQGCHRSLDDLLHTSNGDARPSAA